MSAAMAFSCSRRLSRQRCELLGLKFLSECDDELVEIAVHDRVDFVQRQIDAVIGDAALRKVVRANALAAIARADQALSMRGLFLLTLLAFFFGEARGEHRHRLCAIAML